MTKKIRALIVISLMLNVLLGGVLLGKCFMKWEKFETQQTFNLTAEQKQLVETRFKQFADGNKNQWQGMKASREQLKAILTAPTFDETAFDAAMKKMGDESAKNRQATSERIKLAAKDLSQEERKAFSAKLQEHFRKRFKR